LNTLADGLRVNSMVCGLQFWIHRIWSCLVLTCVDPTYLQVYWQQWV